MTTPTFKRNCLKFLAAIAIAASCCSVSGQTTTNILDSFNRMGAVAGSAPDFTEFAGDTWIGGGAGWNTETTNGGALICNSGFAQLNFTPLDGYVYTLSVTQKVAGAANSSDRWGAVGFDDGNMSVTYDGHGPWMLIKQNGNMESYYNGGAGGVGGPGTLLATGSGFGASTNNLLQIELDTTTPGSWKASVFVNGTKKGNTVALPYGFAISKVFISAFGSVSVTNTGLSLTSIQPTAPTISGEPAGVTNWSQVNTSLQVSATGSQPLYYQWYKDSFGNPLSGQTIDSLYFSPLQGTDSGDYFVVVSNSFGAMTSAVARVYVETNTTMQLTPSIAVHAIPGFDSDAGSGIQSSDTYVCALNFTTSESPLDINGVSFDPVNASGNGPVTGVDSVHGGSWSLSATTVFGRPLETTYPISGGFVDGAMVTLLTEMVRMQPPSVVAGDTMTLTFSNLLATGVYSIRVYYAPYDYPSLPVTFRFNGGGSDEEVFLDEDLGYSENSYGAYFVEYDFTAVTNSASVSLVTFSETTGSPLIYGAALQQVSAPEVAPEITSQPQGVTNWVDYPGTLSVGVSGSLPLHYQWFKDDVEVSGVTASALDFAALTGADSGAYRVIVTNAFGAVTSSVANVLVITDGVWTYTPTISAVQIPYFNSDVSAGIETTNQYLCALDFGGDTNELSINGVPFMQVDAAGNGTGTGTNPQFSGTDTNFGGSWTLTATNSGDAGIASLDYDYPGTVTTQVDGNLQLLLSDELFLGGAPEVGDNMTLTLGGLVPTAKYSLRFYYRMWDGNRPVDFTFNGQEMNETVRVDVDNGGANYLNYEFIAASTEVSVTTAVVASGTLPIFYGVTLQQTAAGAPALQTSVSGSSLTISWDASISGYTLESSDSLPGTNWTEVPGVVNNSVTEDTATGTRFFRLHK